jgi:hypothetical protein
MLEVNCKQKEFLYSTRNRFSTCTHVGFFQYIRAWFLFYVKHVLQYVNGHADYVIKFVSDLRQFGGFLHQLKEPYVRARREPVASTVYKFPFVYNSLQSTYNRVVLNYVIKFVSDLRQFGGFLHQWNWPPRYNWNIVECVITCCNINFLPTYCSTCFT